MNPAQAFISDEPELTEAQLPRLWWTKRLLLAGGVGAVGFAIAVGVCFKLASSRSQEAIATIRACGEPVFVEDFAAKPVPDAQNAALLYKTAATPTPGLPAALQAFVASYDPYQQVSPANLLQMQQIDKLLAPTTDLAHVARFYPQAEWPWQFGAPTGPSRSFGAYLTFGPSVRDQMELSRMLGCVAVYKHLSGDDAAAVEILRDMVRHGDVVNQSASFLITYLFGTMIRNSTDDATQVISVDIKILPQSNAATQPTGPASREQVLSLIHELLDERIVQDAFIGAQFGERAFTYDILLNPSPSVLPISPMALAVWKPALQNEVVRMEATYSQFQIAAKQKTFPAATAALPPENPHSGLTLVTAVRQIGNKIAGNTSQYFRRHFEQLAQRRAQAIALAIRLYQLDHSGEMPQKLEQLVPAYLSAVPEDPFTTTAKPFGYRLGPQPMLYSVGQDGKDDQGSVAMDGKPTITPLDPPPGHPRDRYRRERRDLVFFLSNSVLAKLPSDPDANDESSAATRPDTTKPSEQSPVE